MDQSMIEHAYGDRARRVSNHAIKFTRRIDRDHIAQLKWIVAGHPVHSNPVHRNRSHRGKRFSADRSKAKKRWHCTFTPKAIFEDR